MDREAETKGEGNYRGKGDDCVGDATAAWFGWRRKSAASVANQRREMFTVRHRFAVNSLTKQGYFGLFVPPNLIGKRFLLFFKMYI